MVGKGLIDKIAYTRCCILEEKTKFSQKKALRKGDEIGEKTNKEKWNDTSKYF